MSSMSTAGIIFLIGGVTFVVLRRPLDAWNARTASKWEVPKGRDKTGEYSPYILGVGVSIVLIGLILIVVDATS